MVGVVPALDTKSDVYKTEGPNNFEIYGAAPYSNPLIYLFLGGFMLAHSPIALRCLKAALNADCDGQMGLLDLAGNATLLYHMSEEGKEGKQAFLEKRAPNFSNFPRLP